MLALLLDSFSKMHLPPDCEVSFTIVENGAQLASKETVFNFRTKVAPLSVNYETQPVMGIPFARNKVLDIALREEGDFLTFVDDDETVDIDWLCNLVEVQQTRDLDIIGGPVRLTPVQSEQALCRMIHRGLILRNTRIEHRATRRIQANTDQNLPIITSNWMVRLDFVRKTGVRFDESLGFSGGSDVLFYNDSKKHGAKTGWAPKAIVYEEMPVERLTPAYQFSRTRDQGIASFHRKYKDNNTKTCISSACFILAKLASIPYLLVLALFNKGASLTQASRAAGYAYGRYLALTGARSKHYEKIHGA